MTITTDYFCIICSTFHQPNAFKYDVLIIDHNLLVSCKNRPFFKDWNSLQFNSWKAQVSFVETFQQLNDSAPISWKYRSFFKRKNMEFLFVCQPKTLKCVSIDILPCLSELNEERFQTNWPNRSYTIWFDWENQDFVQKLIQLIKKRRQSGLSLLIRLNDEEWADWTLICRSRLIVAGNKVNNDGPIYIDW